MAVDERAESGAIYTSKQDHNEAAMEAVRRYLRDNLFSFGMRHLIVCGGDLDCMAAHQVSCEVAKKADGSGLQRAFQMYARPLTDFQLAEQSLVAVPHG